MVVTLRRADATSSTNPERDSISQRDRSGRTLRNWIILANVVAWIVIAVAIRLIL